MARRSGEASRAAKVASACLALVACNAVVSSQAAERYRNMGPYGVATTKFSTKLADDTRIYYPTSAYGPRNETRENLDNPPPIASSAEPIPVIAFVLPTYGDTASGWTQRNEPFARHLASYGFAVVSSLLTGGIQDQGRTRVPGYYPIEVYLDAPVHALQAMQRLADISEKGTRVSRFGSDGLGAERNSTLDLLKDAINTRKMAVTGYSVGGAGAMWTLETAEQRWPGHVVAGMMLAPAIGREGSRGNGARSLFVRSLTRPTGLNVTKPLLLLTGSNDNMGGVDGVRNLYKSATKSPRLMLELLGATHCFVPFEIANECSVDSYRQRLAAAEHAVAFFRLYLKDDMDALSSVWGKELIEGSSMPLSTVWRSSAGPLPEGWLEVLQTSGERRAPDGWARLDAEAQVRARAVDAATEAVLQSAVNPPDRAAEAAAAAARAAERALRGDIPEIGIDENSDELPWWVPLPLRIAAQVGDFVGEAVEEGVNAGINAATAPFYALAG